MVKKLPLSYTPRVGGQIFLPQQMQIAFLEGMKARDKVSACLEQPGNRVGNLTCICKEPLIPKLSAQMQLIDGWREKICVLVGGSSYWDSSLQEPAAVDVTDPNAGNLVAAMPVWLFGIAFFVLNKTRGTAAEKTRGVDAACHNPG